MPAYEVINVSQDNVPDPNSAGDYMDVYDVTFTIPPKNDQFTIQVPQGTDAVNEAYTAIMERVSVVQAIYAGSQSVTAPAPPPAAE